MFSFIFLHRIEKLIKGAGKRMEVWEVFVAKALGFDVTPDTSYKMEIGEQDGGKKGSMSSRSAVLISNRLRW
jgi:hypothetical protein